MCLLAYLSLILAPANHSSLIPALNTFWITDY